VSLWTRGVVVCTAVLATSACNSAVEIDSPSVDAADRATCEALLDDLPGELGEQESREIEPSDALGAAWGDPALVLTCGGGMPDDFDRTSPCEEVNGVGWFVRPDEFQDTESDLDVATIGFEPVVHLHLPASYRQSDTAAVADVLAELAAPLKRHLDRVSRCA